MIPIKEDSPDRKATSLVLKTEIELCPFEKKIFILPSAQKIRGISTSGNVLLMAVQDENDIFNEETKYLKGGKHVGRSNQYFHFYAT